MSKQPPPAPTASTIGPCPTMLVGCFGFNGPLRQYFSLYRAVSRREGERGEKGQMRVKMSKQPPPAPTASAVGPCPTEIQIVGRPTILITVGHGLIALAVGAGGGGLDIFCSHLSFRFFLPLFGRRPDID